MIFGEKPAEKLVRSALKSQHCEILTLKSSRTSARNSVYQDARLGAWSHDGVNELLLGRERELEAVGRDAKVAAL